MNNIKKYDEFLNEGMYDKRWPHWIRFDQDQMPGKTVVQYGLMKVGNIDTENEFFAFLKENGWGFKKTGPNTIVMNPDDAASMQSKVKPSPISD